MAELSLRDKRFLEAFLEMESGLVLDFSNQTFREFFMEKMNTDIYDEKYSVNGDSKAQRLKTFWELTNGFNVGLLIEYLIDYYNDLIYLGEKYYDYETERLIKECQKISDRLKSLTSVEELNSFNSESFYGESLEKVSEAIKQNIENNQPDLAIDRLHTYTFHFLRGLCTKHKIPYTKEMPLHSLLGLYLKNIRINSEMTERILKSTISIMESFNKVRNYESLAHPNSVINHIESTLIFNHVINIIKFIERLEDENGKTELPF